MAVEPPAEPWAPLSLREALSGYWRTQDGRVLPIVEMDTAHLKSAIALFSKSGNGDHAKLDELRREIARRGTDLPEER